jgi:Zn-dependent protease with chaperone function
MSGWQLLVGLAGHHIIPAVLASAVIWVMVSLIFGLLPRAGDRVWFLYVAIIKALVALLAGAGVSCLARNADVNGLFGILLPDVVPEGSPMEPHTFALAFANSGLVGYAMAAGVSVGIGLLARRWYRLAPVYRRLYEVSAVSGNEFAQLFNDFDELARRTHLPGTRRPRLLVVRDAAAPAFTVGWRRPAVVLTRKLAQGLGVRELRGIVAHELYHVRRLDYLGRWFAIILRDIMIWNPAVVAWYSRLELEQEKAADAYAAALLEDPQAVAAGLIEIAALVNELPLASLVQFAVGAARGSHTQLAERLDALDKLAASPSVVLPGRQRWSSLLLVGFLLAQPRVAVSLPNLLALFVGHLSA